VLADKGRAEGIKVRTREREREREREIQIGVETRKQRGGETDGKEGEIETHRKREERQGRERES
jgi:hypothetical protein